MASKLSCECIRIVFNLTGSGFTLSKYIVRKSRLKKRFYFIRFWEMFHLAVHCGICHMQNMCCKKNPELVEVEVDFKRGLC